MLTIGAIYLSDILGVKNELRATFSDKSDSFPFTARNPSKFAMSNGQRANEIKECQQTRAVGNEARGICPGHMHEVQMDVLN